MTILPAWSQRQLRCVEQRDGDVVSCWYVSLFYPLRGEPLTSLIQDLPPVIYGDCLPLSCGDLRNIPYTLFHDEDNGDRTTHIQTAKSSGTASFDITCCDAEPAIIDWLLIEFKLSSFLLQVQITISSMREVARGGYHRQYVMGSSRTGHRIEIGFIHVIQYQWIL